MISPGIFFQFFKILIFWIVREGGGGGGGVKGKKQSKMTKNSVMLHISGTVHQMVVIFGTHV